MDRSDGTHNHLENKNNGGEMGSIKAEDVGRRLCVLRTAFGQRPSEIADKFNIDRSAWTRFESGKRIMPYDIAVPICEYYGVSLDWLITGREQFLTVEIRDRLRQASASCEA